MQKKYLFQKKINKLVISITKRIESFFNFFKEHFFYKKGFSKSIKTIDKKIFISVAIIFVSIISYFLIPAFYDENKIKTQLENQILDRYNLKVKLNQNFSYGLFPKPHFSFENVVIQYKSNDIAQSNNLKVFISPKYFFPPDKLNFKNLLFNKTDFKIESSNFKFFIDLLNIDINDHNVKFLNSNFFYLDQNEDIVFLTNLKKLEYFYQDNFVKKLNSKLDIFNIPVSLDIENNIIENKFSTEIKSLPLRLNIKSNSNYDEDKLDGDLDLTLINKNIKVDYSLQNSFLNFKTKKNEINGDINIKPFFISINLDLFYLDFEKIFEENSILINILKSESLNNKNLNGNINVKSKNFKNLNFFDQIEFDILFEEGEIFLQNLTTTFKNSVVINLDDTQLIVDDNKLKFSGFITLDFIDVKKFFEHYQIAIKDRKYIKKINLGFLFHLDDKFIEIDNFKVDGNTNQNLEKFLNNFNSKKDNIFNKILVRNSVKDFFKIISLD